MREIRKMLSALLSTKIRPWTIIDIMIICLGLTFILKRFSEQQIRLQHSPCSVNPLSSGFHILDSRNGCRTLSSFV